ncbi:MAG: hypothetical protein HXS40_00165 [Theionarchaea archaeon]|nr:hypothetical protein [Theionarchaea archaeon]
MVQRSGLVLASVLGCSILAAAVIPYPFCIVAWMVGLFFVTGAGIMLHLEPTMDLGMILTSILAGICVHVVYGYVLSFLHVEMNVLVLLAPSGIAAASVIYKKCSFNVTWKDTVVLVLLLLFVILSFNPLSETQFHLFALKTIMHQGFIPSDYPFYDVPVRTPLGFHFLVYEILFFTRDWHYLSLCGVIMGSFAFIPCYLMARTLHSEKAGLAAGICALFASAAVIGCADHGLYDLGLSLVLEGAVMYWALDFLKHCDIKRSVLIGLGCAAGIKIHPSFVVVLPVILVLVVYSAFHNSKVLRTSPLIFFVGSLVLSSIPYVRGVYDSYSVHEAAYWAGETDTVTPGFVTASVGIWIIFLGALGFLFVKKRYVLFFAGWIGVSASVVVTNGFMPQFPLWFVISSAEGLKTLTIPLSVLAGIGLVHLIKPSWSIVFLLALVLVTPQPVIQGTPPLLSGPYIPTDSQYFLDDQEAMQVLEPYPDIYILNDWWTGTGSSWILPLIEKKVMVPYLYGYNEVGSRLDIPEKEKKSFVVAALPDIESSLLFLREEKVDYIFLSGYVHPEVVWRRNLWDPETLVKSLNYDLVFHKGNTYLFHVKPSFTFSNTYRISEAPVYGGVLVHYLSGKNTVQKDVSPVPVNLTRYNSVIVTWGNISFRPHLYVLITYLDSGYDPFDILVREQEEFYLATVPRTNSGRWETLYFKLPAEVEDGTAVVIAPYEEPVTVNDIAVVTCFRGIKVSDNAVLIGDSWNQINKTYIAKKSAKTDHIYVLSPSITTLNITYVDNAPGNVDFNIVLKDNQLDSFILERTGDGKVKCVSIPMPEGYSFVDIGVFAWENDFTILSLSCE